MPATAQALNVNPSDLTQNITGGVSLLGKYLTQYGNTEDALIASQCGAGGRQ